MNSEKKLITIENPTGFKVLLSLSMLYMAIMICNAILTNRYVGTDAIFILGGTLTSPFVFILDDIIAEVYGYKIAEYLIITGFFIQTLFVLVCQLVVIAPHPSFFHFSNFYYYIFGPSLLRIDISGFIAYMVANLLNCFILSKWKILLKGRYFWLRSIGSTAVASFTFISISILLIEASSLPLHSIFKIILLSFSLKVLYSLIFAYPANLFVNYTKYATGIDVYDFPKKFTPFNYLNIEEKIENYDQI